MIAHDKLGMQEIMDIESYHFIEIKRYNRRLQIFDLKKVYLCKTVQSIFLVNSIFEQ